MPLYASRRPTDTAIEYTAIGRDASYSEGSFPRDSHTHVVSSSTSDTIDPTGSSTNETEGTDAQGFESCQPSIEGAPGSPKPPTINGWPQGPRKLGKVSMLFLIGDVLLLLLPVAFLALAIFAWRLAGKELSATGKTVQRAMNLGPTVYPLAFAAIGSRCLRSIAVHLAERGTTVATLEKLLGSQSLVSAISTAFSLRSINLVSVCLLLFWGLSPLGGQSSLRLLREGHTIISEKGTVYYSDHAAVLDLDEAGSWFPIIPTILSASLASSAKVKAQPVDLWNHPKVPRLEAVEKAALAGVSSGDWLSVEPSLDTLWSSFAGINVQGLRNNTQSNFEAKYNYLRMGCEKTIGGTPDTVLDYLWNSTSFAVYPPFQRDLKYERATNTLTNISVIMTGEDKPLTMSFFLRYGWSSNGTATNYTDLQGSYDMFQRQQISFLYGASFNNNSDFQVYNCTPHVITVETHIECQSDACSVTRLRRIRDDPFDPWDEACDRGSGAKLKCLTLGTQTLFKFFMYFPSAVASYFSTVNPFDDWIAGSNQTYRSLPGDYDRDLRNISDQMVSDRLTTVLNTYWQAGSWGTQVTRAGSFEIPEYPYFGPLYGVSQSIAPDRWINATETTFKTQVPVYVADVGWICALLLISLILLSLGIVNVAVTFMNKAPDLFYYASSLARENPYTNTPDGGTWLDGAERSRLLKDMKVQIADASPENEVGYVVIKSLEEGEEFRSGRLKKGRLYW